MIAKHGTEKPSNNTINSDNCPSSHGITGYLEGTEYDLSKGIYICPCGREYFASIKKPEWITEVKSYST